ncbi:MAG: UDP-N-acetylglucosamine diphosphorylase/glucosamine-1-phosphate N-acetyltransferase [Chloroflexi bacterium]|nr:UDP-N-acetylglucosamine diphosphorylase/glucosamine-1-phosphate N-acetyltransferase [Chloroflexota bacterium]
MKSGLPKVLHTVGGLPMIRRVTNVLTALGIVDIVVVVGADGDQIRQAFPGGTAVALQPEPRGTGDAVRVGLDKLPIDLETILVVGGDTPLVSAETLGALLAEMADAAIGLAAAEMPDPTGYGRVIVDGSNRVQRIVEEVDASAKERAGHFVNGMVFAFNAVWLREAIQGLRPSPSGELYLTQLVEDAVAQGRTVQAVNIADPSEIVGVNTRQQLAEVEAALRQRVCARLMDDGVTIVDPLSTYVDESVHLDPDVVIYPQTFLRGTTRIGSGSIIGPGADIADSQIGSNVRILWSVIEETTVADRVHIGPYCRVRAGAVLGEDVYLGSFAEIKNSVVGARTQMHHFSYLGDADVGSAVNIGAGAVTCNFDGTEKHRTVISDEAFIGSDTMLIAPLTIGKGAATGAGAVVTHDVPAGQRVAGVPARPMPPKPAESKKTEAP